MTRLGCTSALSNGNSYIDFHGAWGTVLILHVSWNTTLFLHSCFDSLIQNPSQELEEEPLQDITICVCNFTDAVRWWSLLQIKNLIPGSSSANKNKPRKQASDYILAWLSGNYSGLIYHPMSPFHCTYLACSSILPCIHASRVWLIFQLSGQAYSRNLCPQDPVSTVYYKLVTG